MYSLDTFYIMDAVYCWILRLVTFFYVILILSPQLLKEEYPGWLAETWTQDLP